VPSAQCKLYHGLQCEQEVTQMDTYTSAVYQMQAEGFMATQTKQTTMWYKK
jgi:hypothetical protein